jgi:hypothetical protein
MIKIKNTFYIYYIANYIKANKIQYSKIAIVYIDIIFVEIMALAKNIIVLALPFLDNNF